MNGDAGVLLAELPRWALGFLLVLSRCGTALMLVPAFGEAEVPATIRAGFTMILSALVTPLVLPHMPPPSLGVFELMKAIGGELLTGLMLGWLARMPAEALPLAGQVSAQMTGFANIIIPGADPGQNVVSRLFGLAVPVLVLGSGLHVLMLRALVGSYDLVAPGQILPEADTTLAAVGAVAEAFSLGLRLAAPFLLAGIMWQIGLGLLARLVPQVHVYFLAMPGLVIGGMVLLALIGGAIAQTWLESMRDALAMLPGT